MIRIRKTEYKSKEILDDILRKDRNIVDLIVEMKNLVNLAIELGFSALILQDRKLVEKIKELEEEIDVRQYEIETECMLASNTPKEALELTSVLRLSSALEDISNSIRELIDSLSRGIPTHPIIVKGLKSSMDVVDYLEINGRSKAVGKTLSEFTQDKVDVIGLKRDGKWEYMPKRSQTITKGDVLIVSGRKNKVSDAGKKV